jgi:hypothetical protein
MLPAKNGHEVMAPSAEDPADAALLACALAFKTWTPEKQAAWPTSREFARVSILCRADPSDYGGEARLRSAIASCIADFDRCHEVTALRGRQLSEVEMEERQGGKKPPPPDAPPGYGYRTCPKCQGANSVRGEQCICTLPVGGQPGYELFIIPMGKGGPQ